MLLRTRSPGLFNDNGRLGKFFRWIAIFDRVGFENRVTALERFLHREDGRKFFHIDFNVANGIFDQAFVGMRNQGNRFGKVLDFVFGEEGL